MRYRDRSAWCHDHELSWSVLHTRVELLRCAQSRVHALFQHHQYHGDGVSSAVRQDHGSREPAVLHVRRCSSCGRHVHPHVFFHGNLDVLRCRGCFRHRPHADHVLGYSLAHGPLVREERRSLYWHRRGCFRHRRCDFQHRWRVAMLSFG